MHCGICGISERIDVSSKQLVFSFTVDDLYLNLTSDLSEEWESDNNQSLYVL